MKNLFVILLLSLVINSNAQSKGSVIQLIDNISGAPVALASVKVLSLPDSILIAQGNSDSAGKYYYDAKGSINRLAIISKPLYSRYIKSFVTDSIVLIIMPDLKEFNNAKITAKQKFILLDVDKTVITPDALISSVGQNALDMIERAPGVLVDDNNGIRIHGLSGVSIYINEQLLTIAGNDLNQYLKSIPAENIQTITVMTNPSAKYPAAGSGGVIVIRLKKSVAKGFNGRYGTNAGTGKLLRHNQSINLNYRINKVNFFSNSSFGWNNNYQDLTIRRAYFNSSNQLNSTFVQKTYIDIGNLQFQTNAGADIYMSDKKTLSVSITGFSLLADRNTNNNAEIRNGSGNLINTVFADIPLSTNFKNLGGNVYYNILRDSGRAGYTIYADVTRYQSINKQSTFNRLNDSAGNVLNETLLIGNLPSYIWVSATGTDYHKESKKIGRIESGYRISMINSDNFAGFYDEVNGVRTVNNLYTNDFDYTENINAAYINWSNRINKWSIQSGLRYENTNSVGIQKGNSTGNDSSFTRQYHSLFPTVFISYSIDSFSNHVIGANFGRRINRANYSDMNPFIYPLDRYTLYAGNPFIKPTYSNELELSYLLKSTYRFNLVYGITNNLISETIEQVNGIFYSRPGNIGQQINYGCNISGSSNLGKKLRLSFYAELNYNKFTGTLYNQLLNNIGTYWYVAPNLQYKINKKWNAEISGTYQSEIASAQFVMVPVGSVRTGISWQFNNSGALRLSLSDVFHSSRPGGKILSLNRSDASWNSILDTRVVMLGFSYKFNKGQSLNRIKNDEIETEKQRVKVG